MTLWALDTDRPLWARHPLRSELTLSALWALWACWTLRSLWPLHEVWDPVLIEVGRERARVKSIAVRRDLNPVGRPILVGVCV